MDCLHSISQLITTSFWTESGMWKISTSRGSLQAVCDFYINLSAKNWHCLLIRYLCDK